MGSREELTDTPEPEIGPWLEWLTGDWKEPGDLEATLNQIAAAAKEAFSADLCVLFAINPITSAFVPQPGVAGDLWHAEEPELLPPPREHGLTRRVLSDGLLAVPDISIFAEDEIDFCRKQGICCFAAVAFHLPHRKPFAVLYADFRQPHTFGPGFESRLKKFAQLASRQLQITWFLRRYQWVGKIGQRINKGIETEEQLFDALSLQVGRIIDTSRCFLLAVHRPENNTVDIHARIDGQAVSKKDCPVEAGLGWLLKNPQPFQIHGLSRATGATATRFKHLPGDLPWKPESLLFVPLLLEGKWLGVVSVQHPSSDIYGEEDRHLLALLANHVALALNNLRLFGHLRRLHEAGQILTRNLKSEEVLQTVVDAIRDITGCDVAILYPYIQASERFELPPRLSGALKDKDFPQPSYVEPGGLLDLILPQNEPVFAADSRELPAWLSRGRASRLGSFRTREGIRSVAAAPLRVGDEPVGVLFVNFRTPQPFDEEAQRLIGGLASYAAIAIKNAREFGAQAQRHIEELEGLQRIDRELSRSQDLEDLLDKILELAAERLSLDEASILLYNPDGGILMTRAAIGPNRDLSLKQVLNVAEGKGIVLEVLRTKMPVLVSDVRAPEWRDRFVDVGGGTRCELDVPLLDDDQIVGILNLESRKPGAFDKADTRLMQTLAGQAVLAVGKEHAYAIQRRLTKEAQTLIELAKELTRQLDVSGLLDLILQRSIEQTRAYTGVLVLCDPKQGDLIVVAERAYLSAELGRRLSRQEGILGHVARTGESVNADLRTSPWKELHIAAVPGMLSELAMPLFAGQQVKGVLNVESPNELHFREEDERFLAALADLAVIALQNAERFKQAEERQERLKALDEVGRKVIEQLGAPDQVMEMVVRNALTLTGAMISDLDLFEANRADLDPYREGKWILHYRAERQDGSPGRVSTRKRDLRAYRAKSPPRGIMTYVARTRQSFLVEGDAGEHPEYRGEKGIRSELAVPLQTTAGELLGVLDVTSRALNAFDEEDRELLELFAAQAVIALENSRNYARAERRLQRFQLLHQAGQELARITDPSQLEDAYGIVVRIAHEHCQSEVAVRRQDPTTRELVLVKSAKKSGPKLRTRIPGDDPLNGKAAIDLRTLIVPDAAHPPPEIGPFTRSNPADKAFVVTPIHLVGGRYYGNIALSHEEVDHFRTADILLIEGLARQLALTLNRLDELEARQEAEKRALEAESMGEIGRQTYGIMHLLGNHLGLVPRWVRQIRGALKQHGLADPGIESLLEKIRIHARKVLDLSKGLADDLSRRGPTELSVEPVRKLIEESIASLEVPNKICIEVQIPDNVGAVHVDYRQLTTALLDLLKNAFEAMPEGGELTVGAMAAGEIVQIWVRDTGCGIAPQEHSRIWNLGYTTKRGGTGFGLWNVRQTILNHGGNIEAESTPGKGTTFTLFLPRVEEMEG